MELHTMRTSPSVWIGRALSGLVIVVLAADASVQLAGIDAIRAEMAATGFPYETAPIIGFIAAACAITYAVPRTAFVGAILISAFFGGAIATHLRLGEIASPPQILSVLLGVMTWGGLYLRNAPFRSLLAVR
jgi:hypothetical protein